ncbi:MAG: tail fiber protein [Pirellulales bacterium]
MADPFIGEIRMFGFGFAPKGWAACDGAILPIRQNPALFSLLGTNFGGDGKSTFGLPDLRGRVPLGGAGMGLGMLGEAGGAETVQLTLAQIPSHTHTMAASTTDATLQRVENSMVGVATKSVLAKASFNLYGPPGNPQALSPQTIGSVGGQQAHENMQPYLTVNFCIALQGVFPPRP